MGDQIAAGVAAEYIKNGATGAEDVLTFVSYSVLGGTQGMCVIESNISMRTPATSILLPNGSRYNTHQTYTAPTYYESVVIEAMIISNETNAITNDNYISDEFKRITAMNGEYGQLSLRSSAQNYTFFLGRIVSIAARLDKNSIYPVGDTSRPPKRQMFFTLTFEILSYVGTT